MKRPFFLIPCLIVCLASRPGYGQDWSAALTVDPYPSPFLSDWQTDPTMAALEITNPTGKPDVIILDLDVSSSEGARFQGSSQRMLVDPGQTLTMNSTEFNAWYTGALNEAVKDKATRTGMMPEGSYQACVTVKNLWGTILARNVCAYFTIVHPEPPELIYPINGLDVAEAYPVFQWMPPQMPAGKQIVHVFRMVKVMQGQTPETALAANYPHYENFNVFDSNLEYPLDGLPLEPNATYAWQVQALDFEGKPVTKNEGRSVIGIFATSSEFEGVQPELQLLSPNDQAVLTVSLPEFQWIEPVVAVGGPLHYTIRIAEIRPGQTPEEAMRRNSSHFSSPDIIGQTNWTYPGDAPALTPDARYAWQVQALDAFGNPAAIHEGKSEAWVFTVSKRTESQVLTALLPERLPLLGVNTAYLALTRNGSALVNYIVSPDTSSVTLDGDMEMVLPALQGKVASSVVVNGQLTFNPRTLAIISGSLQGDLPASADSPLNLNAAGVPLILTHLRYSAGQNDRLDCSAVPFLFGKILSGAAVSAVIHPDGSVSSNIQTSVSERFPLVANSDKVLYQMRSLQGTILAYPAAAVSQIDLTVTGGVLLSTRNQEAELPADLTLTGDGATTRFTVQTQNQIDLDLGSLSLALSDLSCRKLQYLNSTGAWMFDIGFDLAMDFKDLGVKLPAVLDVHMSRLGIEIPSISAPDLGTLTEQTYGDLWVRPRAFRMYSHTFNWAGWKGGDIGDWGFFWDLDVRLPHLPRHLAVLGQMPFRANNATYVNGAFGGSWNVRTFEPALFVPLADSVNWGLSVHEVKGVFTAQSGSGASIGVKADWASGGDAFQASLDGKGFTPEQLSFSPRGIFTGQLASIALSKPLPWSSYLAIQSQSAGLALNGINGQQAAFINAQGSVSIPTRSGTTIGATGAGTFDLYTKRLVDGRFVVQNAFSFGLPWPDPLIGLECGPGAVLDAQGLHVSLGSNNATLSSGDKVSCETSGDLIIALPNWELAAGTIRFKETFALRLSDWSSNPMQWRTLPASGDAQSGIDNLFLPLPNPTRMDGNALVASGRGKSVIQYRGQKYKLDSKFSGDFLFSLAPAGVKQGGVEFSMSDTTVANLDSTGLHLGPYFGVDLASARIGLPDTVTAWLDMAANPNLSLKDEGGLKRIKGSAFIHFPGLKYQSKTAPAVQADVNILVNPSTYVLSGGTIQAKGTPLVSLSGGKVPIEIASLDFSNNQWAASVRPILPMALRSNRLTADGVSVDGNGLKSVDSGFSAFGGSPRDSVVLGTYLTVTLDGIRIVSGGLIPTVSFSGDFKSPIFGGEGVHFTAGLTTDSAAFSVRTLNVVRPFGCGTLALVDQNGLPKVEAPMNKQDFVFAVCGVLNLDALSKGCALTLPRLEIRGYSVAMKQPDGASAQSLKLFGADVTVKQFDLTFGLSKSYDLVLNGSMKLFGKSVDFTDLRIPNGCSAADGVLARFPSGVRLNVQMALQKLEIQSGNLAAGLGIFRPEPFLTSAMDSLKLAVNPEGKWLDAGGNPLKERKWTISAENASKAPRVLLGNDKFSINAYLAAITLGFDGQDNTGDEGSVVYQVDTYWPEKNALGGVDSVRVQTDGLYRFNATTATNSWSFSQDTPVDTITTMLDNDLFMHASDFSMADTAVYQIHFNSVMQLPLPADVVNGQAELIDNRLGLGLWETGKLHTAQVYIAGLTFELLDFHYAKNEWINSKEIEFSKTVASVDSVPIWADLYLSFGANMNVMPGVSGGIERLVIFKNKDEFHLLVKHWNAWVGDYLFFDADILGSFWWGDKSKGEKTKFKLLVGGNLELEMGDVKGGALVGEISYRETVNVNNQVETVPGFGLFCELKFELDLTPIPITLTGLGLGMFFNPSKEIREMVYYHTLGYYEQENKEICDEFKAVMDATQDDMMTVGEVYLFGSGSIPKKDFLDATVLLTLATDRIKLNSRVAPAEKMDIAKTVDLSGWVEAECAWKQDFSGFKYLAGHWKIGGRAAIGEQTKVIKLPESAQAQLDFIVTKEAKFAVAGRLAVETLGNQYLTAECDFTFGNPGFVFSGGVGFGYDIYILKIEAGMEIKIYLKWKEPVKFGIAADCYIEGSVISDWLASFRGEMGAALVAEPDLYLYGYAELTGTILGVSKTVKAWAKWEEGGKMSSGTGEDPTMEEFIAEAQSVADEIMTSLVDLKAELNLLEAYNGFSEEDVQKIIQSLLTGQYEPYIKAWDQDYQDAGKAAVKIIEDLDKDGRTDMTDPIRLFFNDLSNEREAITNKGVSPLLKDVNRIGPYLARLKTSLENRVANLQTTYDGLKTAIDSIDFSIDTLMVLTDVGTHPIQNPLAYSTESIEGVGCPVIALDETMDAGNTKSIENLQRDIEGWLAKTDSNIRKIKNGRLGIFARIGPDSPISKAQAELSKPLLSTNENFVLEIADLNKSFSTCYGYYDNISKPWDADKALTILAEEDGKHRDVSIELRKETLANMHVPLDDLPVNEVDQYRVLGNLFYRTMPQIILSYYIKQADSLMLAFEGYAKGVQSSLDTLQWNCTSDADLLWDKYAELSEKVYAILDLYRSTLKTMPGAGENLVLKDSTDILLSGLEKEFTYPTVTPKAGVSQNDGFLPVTMTLDCESGDPDRIAEYAVSLNDCAPQSMGNGNRLDRDYMLRHGVSYWIETNGGIAHPFTDTEKRSVKAITRVRNKAGLTAWTSPVAVEMSGKDWWWATSPNRVVSSLKPDSMYRCLESWPYPAAPTRDGTVNVSSEKDELRIRWSLQHNYGIGGMTVVPAKHRIELKQGNKTVFGPEFFPVTQNTPPDTFEVKLTGLDLRADTGEPVQVNIQEYDLSDVMIGGSSGKQINTGTKQDGSTITETESWEPAALYIDSTPPVFSGQAQYIDIGDGRCVIYKLPKAKEEVKLNGWVYSEWISDSAAYEYQLLPRDGKVESWNWKTLAGSDLLASLPATTAYNQNLQTLTNSGSGVLFLNLAPAAFADSVKLVLRARNERPGWSTGYSEPASFLIPKADESEAPVPAEFQIAGQDSNGNLILDVVKAGTDGVSGVSHYAWKLEQNLYRSRNPNATVWHPESNRFPADSVKDGAKLTIPILANLIDADNAFTVELYTFDRCGNFAMTRQEFLPEPPVPVLTARLLEGMKPFTLSFAGDFSLLSEKYIDTLVVRIGTVPDASDIAEVRWPFTEIAKRVNSGTFNRFIDLSATVDEGTSVYLSAVNVRGGKVSQPFTQRVQIYKPMFQTVETDKDGFLVLPILRSAFNGQKEVSTFEWAVGYLAPSLQGQNRYQLNIQPLTALSGVTGEQVAEGARIKLPVKAGDVRPLSLVVLRATALDGEIHATFREVAIVPPKPELKVNLALDPGDYGRFFYRLNVEAKFGSLLQTNFTNSTAKAEALLKIESDAGAVRNLSIPLMTSGSDGFTRQEIILDSTVASMDRIFLTAFSKTSEGTVSKDSATMTLDVPWPSFWKDPKVDFDGNLTILPARPGHRNTNEIIGYQFAVGDGEGKSFNPRPYPSSLTAADIPSSAWQSGRTLTLPFSVRGLVNKTYRVGLRAVLRDGRTNEQVLTTQPFLQPKVDASIVEAFPQNKLVVRGDLGPEMAAQITKKELSFQLTLNGEIQFDKYFIVPDNGAFEVSYNLPDKMPKCETYQFKSFFWHTQSQQFAMYARDLDMPCEPMFITVDADSQDMIFVDVLREAFNDNRSLQGYQFALGSGSGKNDVRAFPAEGQFDFTPDRVQAGKRLTLPSSLTGVPSTCFVALRGLDGQGKIHLTEKSFQARPPRPVVLSLKMNKQGQFTAEFDPTRFDDKVRCVDCWIRLAQDPDRVISFIEFSASELRTGSVAFDSGFTDQDAGLEWILEGLSVGYQINSLDFQYRFRIEKAGDAYRIVALP